MNAQASSVSVGKMQQIVRCASPFELFSFSATQSKMEDGQEHKDGEEIIIDEGDGDEDIEIRDIENGDKEIYIRIMDRYFCVIY